MGVAFLLVLAAFGVQTQAYSRLDRKAQDTSYRVYRVVIHGLLLVALMVILAGDQVTWMNCATGFLWRAWLGVYILPWWLVALRS